MRQSHAGTGIARTNDMIQIDRRRVFNCPIFVTTVCLAALFVGGCDECDGGARMCRGENVLATCAQATEDGNTKWSTTQCPVVCRQVGSDATCVDSREPVAECANSVGSSAVCFGEQRAYCWHGYLFQLEGCAGGTHCRLTTCGGSCVVGDSLDSRCSATVTSFCDGNARAICECGFEKSRGDCGASFCHEGGGEARCTEATQDPRCGDPAQAGSGFCDGNVVGMCWYGFAMGGQCPPSQTCQLLTTYPYATCSGFPPPPV
jgi:hypothetical protein